MTATAPVDAGLRRLVEEYQHERGGGAHRADRKGLGRPEQQMVCTAVLEKRTGDRDGRDDERRENDGAEKSMGYPAESSVAPR